MSQFYARYVPPSKVQTNTTSHEQPSPKRKRSPAVEDGAENKQLKKRRKGTRDNENNDTNTSNEHTDQKKDQGSQAQVSINGNDILNRYRISEFVKTQSGVADVKIKNKQQTKKDKRTKSKNDNLDSHSISKQSDEITKQGEHSTEDQLPEQDSIHQQKHEGVFSKFRKAKGRNVAQVELLPEGDDERTTELHGLEPIPQPEELEPQTLQLPYSILPSWQSKATTIKPNKKDSFEHMGISNETLSNLNRNGIRTAFPVQSTVIPMLLEQSAGSESDICVSAATGSGKTLAYVIPIIEALRKKSITGLKAVIVVPTRELVKQVRDTCELCASGSSISIVTAAGSKSLKSEQDALIEQTEIYNPGEWRKQQDAAVDWSSFTLQEAVIDVQNQRHPIHRKDFVVRKNIRANLLITTPGRLVDHLQNTDGFHLDDVQWLVVDEADRLLNESYQEWVEVVIPALNSRAATKVRDDYLSHMRMDLPPRKVRKVLLSATMTQDISKLNALELNEPRLVVLKSMIGNDSQQNDPMNGTSELDNSIEGAEGDFHLPAKLTETVITLTDGADKPLVLLKLLQEHIHIQAGRMRSDKLSDEERSNDETSTSDSSSDSESATEDTDSSNSSSLDGSSSEYSASTSSENTDNDGESVKNNHSLQTVGSRAVIGRQSHRNTPRALVFARSTASATRLSRLLSLISPKSATRISTLTRSTASSASSRQALASFRSGKSTILIATDRASRGIDIPNLENVVNYDIPGSSLTYIHRVGRTARAGKEGQAWTLVEHREGRWFWSEIGGKSSNCKIKRTEKMHRLEMKIEDANLRAQYESALATLGEEVRGE